MEVEGFHAIVSHAWEGSPPDEAAVELSHTVDPAHFPTLENVLVAVRSAVRGAVAGTFEVIELKEPLPIPAAKRGPKIFRLGQPLVEMSFGQENLPPGFYLLVSADQKQRPDETITAIRSLLICLAGRGISNEAAYLATYRFRPELGYSIASPAIEIPQSGFVASVAQPALAEKIALIFLNAHTHEWGKAAIAMFALAHAQDDLTTRHVLYWAAIETAAGGVKRVGNRIAAANNTTVSGLDVIMPYNRLKSGRDAATHHGKKSSLSQADERLLQAVFIDLLAYEVEGFRLGLAQQIATALGLNPTLKA